MAYVGALTQKFSKLYLFIGFYSPDHIFQVYAGHFPYSKLPVLLGKVDQQFNKCFGTES